MTNNYCVKCGAKLAQGAKFCAKCGHPLESKNEATGKNKVEDKDKPKDFKQTFGIKEEEYDEMISKKPKKLSEKDKLLVGAGGWLAYFLISLLVGACINGYNIITYLGLLSQEALQKYASLIIVPTFGFLILLVLQVTVFILILRHKKMAKLLAITLIVLSLITYGLDGLITVSIYESLDSAVPSDLWNGAGRVVVYAFIWIPYFLSSNRVRLTLTK